MLSSLDRKVDWHKDPRSNAVCLVVQMAENSLREKSKGSPDWANNLHHQLVLKLLNFNYILSCF